ncbi:MAG: HD-GYP domain-containing protein [Thermodesulfobacteriota bacterium]
MSIRLFDMVACLSSAMDLVSPEVVGHHRRVGILAHVLGGIAGLPDQARADLALAGMLHDVGAFSLKDRLSALAFEASDQTHPETGYRLLSGYPGFARAAGLVREHHSPWNASGAAKEVYRPVSELGNLLCLADRLDTILPRKPGVPLDRESVASRIRSAKGRMFNPWWVDAFEELLGRETLLEQILFAAPSRACLAVPDDCNPELTGKEVSKISRLFSQIIDFRCRFTATHSRGVSATAMALAAELRLDGESRDRLEIASELHDLGKLGVPAEIILKPGPLDSEEMALMQRHAAHGFNVLSGTPGMDGVAELVGQHHERLDGKGYPGGVDASGIGLPSRVLAVSDVFTALAEDRPYRAGMELSRIVSLLKDMAASKALDQDVVATVAARRHHLDEVRHDAQAQALADFERFSLAAAP